LYLLAPPETHWPDLGLTLDDIRDYELLKKIIEYFEPENPFFTCLNTIQLLNSNKDWIDINKDVERKGDA
jgi:spore coat polysaccharide biosynthesis protein SpsF